MTLANGRPYAAIPGPSVIPDRVLRAMMRPAPNIYQGEIVEIAASLWPDLRALAGTRHHVAAYICNGHGLWEAVISNLFSRGDTALVVASGRFGLSWAGHLKAMGVDVQVFDCGASKAPDWDALEAVLRADKGHKINAVLTTHVDTASSVKTDIPRLRAVMDSHLDQARRIDATGRPEGSTVRFPGVSRVKIARLRLRRVLAPLVKRQL